MGDRQVSLKQMLDAVDEMPVMKDNNGIEFIMKSLVKMRIGLLPSAQPECEDDPRADVYYLAEKIGIHRLYSLVVDLRGEPEMRHCVSCGRTANNGGVYPNGRTKCPIEEHYALPTDGYCRLWQKKKVWEDESE